MMVGWWVVVVTGEKMITIWEGRLQRVGGEKSGTERA